MVLKAHPRRRFPPRSQVDPREQHLTVILVTHEPDVAAWADRVITFRDGAIVSDVDQKRTSPRRHGDTERTQSP